MAKTILIADDEANITRLVQMNLERNGFKVVTAADGREALEKLETMHPDLVVLDVMMPFVDGFEVLKRMKQDPLTSDIPVIMLTVKAQDADIFEAEARGADVYLTKPINPNELVTFVNRVLESKE
jgi:two-component system alkaline phosphatase synthesis response regulator PhoP/two-component system response regulator VicR